MDASKPSGLSSRLVVGLALAIGLDTVVQVMWKRASDRLPAIDHLSAEALGAVGATLLHQPIFLLVAVLIAAQMINWLLTLDHADVSFAQPITALSYVSVALVSRFWLGESITPLRILGMAVILAGVVLVARSDPNTEPTAPKVAAPKVMGP
jgi:drug/metabolite transporter (DMT)-like permease